jgi:hypothetical protein
MFIIILFVLFFATFFVALFAGAVARLCGYKPKNKRGHK